MRMRISGDKVVVTLSRRNLAALLSKLDDGLGPQGQSACMIMSDYNTDGNTLVVQAEPDELHYSERAAPGAMHTYTETRIRPPSP